MARPVAALLVLLAALTACSQPVAGSAVPNADAAREAAEPLTSQRALGELTTIDYCSLVEARALPRDLGQLVLNPKPSFDFCGFKLKAQGIEVEVEVGFLDDADTLHGVDRTTDRTKHPPRGLQVQRGTEQKDLCVRYLLFTDEISITVSADSYVGDSPGQGDWCPIADATLGIAVDRVVAKKVRHYEFGAKSLGKVDACDLVPANLVATRIGAPTATVLKYPSGHECHWTGSGDDTPDAHLYFGHNDSSFDPDSTKEETLAGQHTYVTPDNTDQDAAFCQVSTDHIDSPQLGVKEQVRVEVVVPGKGKDACAPARELAKEVWAKLPR
jgi:hypothetical protein